MKTRRSFLKKSVLGLILAPFAPMLVKAAVPATRKSATYSERLVERLADKAFAPKRIVKWHMYTYTLDKNGNILEREIEP